MTPRRFGIALMTGVLLLGTSGCYKATFYKNASVVKGEEHEEWTDFFVFGTVGSEELDVKKFCSNGDAAVIRTGGNVGTGVVSVLTIGIYTPRKVYVTCPAAGAARTARRLELELGERGEPLRGQVTDADEHTEVVIEPAGARAWRMSRGTES
jgi:hypothetical protein